MNNYIKCHQKLCIYEKSGQQWIVKRGIPDIFSNLKNFKYIHIKKCKLFSPLLDLNRFSSSDQYHMASQHSQNICKFIYIILCEIDRHSRFNAWDRMLRDALGCTWDDPEWWDGEGGGKGVQDGEHMYTHGWFMSVYGKKRHNTVK